MNKGGGKPSLYAPLGGVVVGVAVFLGVNITTGRAIIPTAESVTSLSHGLSEPVRPVEVAPVAAGGPYQTVCITCHQAEGQGIPGAFPPLAASEWLLGNPEIPVRVVLLGLSGPITVAGKQFNSAMPPPPGLDDAKIAEAITYARSHFGNHAAKLDTDFVKKVRGSLAGRTAPMTPAELAALQTAAGSEAAPAEGAKPTEDAPTAPDTKRGAGARQGATPRARPAKAPKK